MSKGESHPATLDADPAVLGGSGRVRCVLGPLGLTQSAAPTFRDLCFPRRGRSRPKAAKFPLGWGVGVRRFIYLFIYLSVYLRLFICLFIYLFVYLCLPILRLRGLFSTNVRSDPCRLI